jgi:hypothetical protein
LHDRVHRSTVETAGGIKRDLDNSDQNIPFWPLNVGLWRKFVTAQIVPLLGLTGLGVLRLKVVDAPTKFMGHQEYRREEHRKDSHAKRIHDNG